MNNEAKDNFRQDAGQICVAGAGAIGTTLALRLASSFEHVSVLARGKTLSAILDNGVTLIDEAGRHTAHVRAGDAQQLGEQDIVVLCAKAQDLVGLAESVQPLLHARTIIVPVVNGVPWWYFEDAAPGDTGRPALSSDPDGQLRRLLPSENVVGTVAMIMAERRGLGIAQTLNPMKMIVGEIGRSDSDHAKIVAKILNRAGVQTSVADPLRGALWQKVLINLASNPLSVVSESTAQDMCDNPDLVAACHALYREGASVAHAYGYDGFDFEQFMAIARGLGPFKTSMLQDYLSGRILELDAICNSVVDLAAHKGLDMPLTKQIVRLARHKQSLSTRAEAA